LGMAAAVGPGQDHRRRPGAAQGPGLQRLTRSMGPAAGPRWAEVPPERLAGWVDAFAARHGPRVAAPGAVGAVLRARRGARAPRHPPAAAPPAAVGGPAEPGPAGGAYGRARGRGPDGGRAARPPWRACRGRVRRRSTAPGGLEDRLPARPRPRRGRRPVAAPVRPAPREPGVPGAACRPGHRPGRPWALPGTAPPARAW